MAEAREMKRVPNVIKSGRYSLTGVPSSYTMGVGHVKFFYNKLGWLLQRYKQVYNEGIRRGFSLTDFSTAWQGVPQEFMGEWQPDSASLEISRKRIDERLAGMEKIHYLGQRIDYQKAKELLWHN
jgi:hypothetical protein